MTARLITLFTAITLCLLTLPAAAEYRSGLGEQTYKQQNFDDTLLELPLDYPDWFKLSHGILRDDLAEAVKNGKDGIVVYFGQKRCAYCQLFINTSLASVDIEHSLRTHFDLIPIDIWGIDTIIDTNGTRYTERELSRHYKTNFTPSLVFYDKEGTPVFRLRGYHAPYQFRAALQYVTEKFYKSESFRDYLERAVPGMFFMEGGLNEREFFVSPPYNLKQLSAAPGKPLVVFFEQGECHTCDLLHTGPLIHPEILKQLSTMNVVQIDMWATTPVITPAGDSITAREWAKKLELFYAPTLIFFDANGEEIIRLDSVVQFYRLSGVLDYINKQAYKTDPDYQEWRLRQRTLN